VYLPEIVLMKNFDEKTRQKVKVSVTEKPSKIRRLLKVLFSLNSRPTHEKNFRYKGPIFFEKSRREMGKVLKSLVKIRLFAWQDGVRSHLTASGLTYRFTLVV